MWAFRFCSPTLAAMRRFRLLSAAMNSPLFDTRLVTRNLERAYEAMWEIGELGLPPSHIGERWSPLQSTLYKEARVKNIDGAPS